MSFTVGVSLTRAYTLCAGTPAFASKVAATPATSSAPTSGMTVLSSPHGRKAVLCSATLWLTRVRTFSYRVAPGGEQRAPAPIRRCDRPVDAANCGSWEHVADRESWARRACPETANCLPPTRRPHRVRLPRRLRPPQAARRQRDT